MLLNIVEYLEFLKAKENMPENLKEQLLSFTFYQFLRQASRKILFLIFFCSTMSLTLVILNAEGTKIFCLPFKM